MNEQELDNIEALKATREKTKLSDDDILKLRKEVREIMERREKEEKERRRAEMERFYEFGLYA